MTFGVLGSPGEVNSQVGSVLRWPVSVIAVAYPLSRNIARSTGLAEELRVPANPPTPLKINFPFQLAGSIASKPAEFGPGPSPAVVTEPFTSQYCGFGAAAGTSVADVIVMFGTLRALSAATLQSVPEAGTAAMTLQSSTARPTNGMRTLCLGLSSTRAFMCDPPIPPSLGSQLAELLDCLMNEAGQADTVLADVLHNPPIRP